MPTAPPCTVPPPWRISAAVGAWARTRGLLGRRALGDHEGLWLPVRSVHTVGMRFALDLVWLAADGTVAATDAHVRPGRCRTRWRARGGVVEVAAGRAPALVAALREPTG